MTVLCEPPKGIIFAYEKNVNNNHQTPFVFRYKNTEKKVGWNVEFSVGNSHMPWK